MLTSRLNLGKEELHVLLDKEELAQITQRSMKKSSILYADDILFVIIEKGFAKLAYFENGEEFIIYYMKQGNLTCLDQSCALEFLEDSRIYTISMEELKRFDKNPNFAFAVQKIFVRIILTQRDITKNLLFQDAKGRIISFLLELAKEQNTIIDNIYIVHIPFSIGVFANFLGLRRQSVSTAFNKLLKDGIIKRISTHHYAIEDIDLLKEHITR